MTSFSDEFPELPQRVAGVLSQANSCTQARLHEPQTKRGVRSQAAEEVARVHVILLAET
jgi:hypothetical protein